LRDGQMSAVHPPWLILRRAMKPAHAKWELCHPTTFTLQGDEQLQNVYKTRTKEEDLESKITNIPTLKFNP
jgi:hypothetical protein